MLFCEKMWHVVCMNVCMYVYTYASSFSYPLPFTSMYIFIHMLLHVQYGNIGIGCCFVRRCKTLRLATINAKLIYHTSCNA